MARVQTISDGDFSGKKVLVRVDFNAPVDDSGAVSDDTRLRAALPTINALLDQGAQVILMSHRGRPSGTGFEESYSLAPIAARLGELLERDIVLAEDIVGPSAQADVYKRQCIGKPRRQPEVRWQSGCRPTGLKMKPWLVSGPWWQRLWSPQRYARSTW